jgi:hypothetical protein
MACPDCGLSIGEFRIVTSIETHGLDCGPFERFDQEFILCRECGGRFDVSEWDSTSDGGVESANQLARATSPAAWLEQSTK